MPIRLEHIPTERFELLPRIFDLRYRYIRIKRDGIAIVNQN